MEKNHQQLVWMCVVVVSSAKLSRILVTGVIETLKHVFAFVISLFVIFLIVVEVSW